MAVQTEVTDAIDGGRDELVGVLARNRVLPSVDEEYGGSDLLGGSSSPTFMLEHQREDTGALDRQTKSQIVDALGLDSAKDCEAVRSEIKAHPAWDE